MAVQHLAEMSAPCLSQLVSPTRLSWARLYN